MGGQLHPRQAVLRALPHELLPVLLPPGGRVRQDGWPVRPCAEPGTPSDDPVVTKTTRCWRSCRYRTPIQLFQRCPNTASQRSGGRRKTRCECCCLFCGCLQGCKQQPCRARAWPIRRPVCIARPCSHVLSGLSVPFVAPPMQDLDTMGKKDEDALELMEGGSKRRNGDFGANQARIV